MSVEVLKTPTVSTTLLVLWNSFCCVVIVATWPAMTVMDQRLAVLCFQPYLPLCAMIWLWSVNVCGFERLGIPYEKLFGSDDAKLLPRAEQLSWIGHCFGSALLTTVAFFLSASAAQVDVLVEWIPVLFLCLMLITLLCPIPSSIQQSHAFFIKTMSRVLTPIRKVTFADFLLADILTSLARSLADLERSICAMTIRTELRKGDFDTVLEQHCPRGAWHTYAVLALPYIIRMIQCLIVYNTERNILQTINAVKYLTVLPVIASSVIKHHAIGANLKQISMQIWFYASVLNTVFSYFWDIEMDWDISLCRRDNSGKALLVGLPPDALYTPKAVYFFAIISNFAIRIAWIYKLSIHLHYSPLVHMSVALLEAMRRCQWVFIRVECGLRKLAKTQAHRKSPPKSIDL